MNKTLKLRILVVEDDKATGSILTYNLNKKGYHVHWITDGAEAAEWAKQARPDLILLDWALPSKSGPEICQELRQDQRTSSIPIILVSARSEPLDKVTSLNSGADDYITKPFAPGELIARVNAVFRRTKPGLSTRILKFHDLVMNLDTHTVSRNETELQLAPIEFQILQIMMEQPENVQSRKALIEKIWRDDSNVDPRTVDVHITRLRKALMSASSDDVNIIKTIRLAGYKLHIPKHARLQSQA